MLTSYTLVWVPLEELRDQVFALGRDSIKLWDELVFTVFYFAVELRF